MIIELVQLAHGLGLHRLQLGIGETGLADGESGDRTVLQVGFEGLFPIPGKGHNDTVLGLVLYPQAGKGVGLPLCQFCLKRANGILRAQSLVGFFRRDSPTGGHLFGHLAQGIGHAGGRSGPRYPTQGGRAASQ